jgi:hypothetical protein
MAEPQQTDVPAILAAAFLCVFLLHLKLRLSSLWRSTSSQFPLSRAPVTSIIAYYLSGEVPTVITLIGGSITISGVILANTKGRLSANTRHQFIRQKNSYNRNKNLYYYRHLLCGQCYHLFDQGQSQDRLWFFGCNNFRSWRIFHLHLSL